MILWLILIFLLFVLFFLLFAPLIIQVDSDSGQYEARWNGITRVNLVFRESAILHLKIFRWKKEVDLLSGKKSKKKVKEKKPGEKKKNILPGKIFKKTIALLKSFRIHYFYLDIDTGNYLLNASLYPVAGLMTRKKKTFRINFMEELHWKMKITNNLFRMIMAFIK